MQATLGDRACKSSPTGTGNVEFWSVPGLRLLKVLQREMCRGRGYCCGQGSLIGFACVLIRSYCAGRAAPLSAGYWAPSLCPTHATNAPRPSCCYCTFERWGGVHDLNYGVARYCSYVFSANFRSCDTSPNGYSCHSDSVSVLR